MPKVSEQKCCGDPRLVKGGVPKLALKRELKRRGIAQKEFAARINVKPETLSRYLSGAEYMPDDKVVRAADALRVDPREILQWNGASVENVRMGRECFRLDGTQLNVTQYGTGEQLYWDEFVGETIYWPSETMPGDYRDPTHLGKALIAYIMEVHPDRADAALDALCGLIA